MEKIKFIYQDELTEKELNIKKYSSFSSLLNNEFFSIKDRIVAIEIDSKDLVDLSESIINYQDCKQIKWIDIKSKIGLDILRHSTTHLMAQAIFRLFKNVKCAHGPTTEYGFFYDFDFEESISTEDFEKIESEMKSLSEARIEFKRKLMNIQDAIEYFKEKNAPYKLEILKNIKESGIDTVSLYEQKEFLDLCRGPHVPNSHYIKHFKLLKISGVYWKDRRDKMLSRIYGVGFSSQEDLKDHLEYLEILKKRDHRVLGKQFNWFYFEPSVPGFPFWKAKGLRIYKALKAWITKENELHDYQEVKTPILLDENLWKKTGHYDHFKENMFFLETKEGDVSYAIKPMNCPGHAMIYNQDLYSYKNLPLRISEFGLVHRNELSGVLYGLFRVRNFTQDDGHIFCKIIDIKSEIIDIIKYTLKTYEFFGFKKYDISISIKEEGKLGYVGNDEEWEQSTQYLKEALESLNLSYSIKIGEAAFYGPKIEFNIEDSLKRNWQCGTIQIDFNIGKCLNLNYRNKENKIEKVIVIHRAILGSLERFIGILIEEYAGDLPLYLTPIQVRIIPIEHQDHLLSYVNDLKIKLLKENIRADIETMEESLSYRIRKNELEKIPYLMIIGNKEFESKSINIRKRKEKQFHCKDFIEFITYIKNQLKII